MGRVLAAVVLKLDFHMALTADCRSLDGMGLTADDVLEFLDALWQPLSLLYKGRWVVDLVLGSELGRLLVVDRCHIPHRASALPPNHPQYLAVLPGHRASLWHGMRYWHVETVTATG